MSEKTKEKETDEKPAKPAGKLILFNRSRNPYYLGKNPDGSKRMFLVGSSMECKDQKEYDMLRNYKGVSTTAQVSPDLNAHVQNLQEQIAVKDGEIADLKKRLEKFESKGK